MSDVFAPIAELICAGVLVILAFTISSTKISSTHVQKIYSLLINLCREAGFSYTPETLRNLVVGVYVVSGLCGLIVSPLIAICSPFIVSISIAGFLHYRAHQIHIQSRNINDNICYFVARTLRAGYSLDQAIARAYEQFSQSSILQNIHRHIYAGSSFSRAVNIVGTGDALSSPEKMLCATLSLAHTMGGNSARIFERIGDCFHQNYELQADTVASLSQVRMSTYVIGALPVIMLALSMVMGTQTTAFLFTHPLGWACLITGFLLEFLGVLWMKKLVSRGVGVWTS
ncbi:MAG TPA: type II secretion system F family protein [Acidimicrobiia bacterium]|nr:type II secretion system F family protein [Acidimicrobiia bacterium]